MSGIAGNILSASAANDIDGKIREKKMMHIRENKTYSCD